MDKKPEQKPIRLIGMDFDNTLYSGDGSLTPLLAWFERLHQRGIQLGLVTGRTFGSLELLFERDGFKWGTPFPDFVICFESRILDASGSSMPGCDLWNQERDQDIQRAHAILEAELEHWRVHLESENLAWKNLFLDPSYGLYLEFGSPEESTSARDILKSRTRPEHGLRFVRNFSGLSVHAENRSKGPALKQMVDAMVIEEDEVLVIGDSHNDLCMMNGDYRFQPATVSNADPVIVETVRGKNGIISEHPCGRGVADIFSQIFG